MSNNAIQQVQIDMYERLLATPYFDDIGVVIYRPREKGGLTMIQSDVDKHLAGLVKRGGKSGALVMVMMPVATAVDPNVPGPRLSFRFVVRVYERPMVNMSVTNGTLKTAEDIALEVCQLFHHFKPNPAFQLNAAANAISPVDETGNANVVYDCGFDQLTGLDKPAKWATPIIAQAAPGTEITMTAVGGSIWFTRDGSYPWSGNPEAELYTIPIFAFTDQLIRAAAEGAGKQQSNVANRNCLALATGFEILLENGTFILMENGGFIELETAP